MFKFDSYFQHVRFSLTQKIVLLLLVIAWIVSVPGLYALTEGSYPRLKSVTRTSNGTKQINSKNSKKSTTDVTQSARAELRTLSNVDPVKKPDPSQLPSTTFKLAGPFQDTGIDVNEAPASVIEMLPGIGPKTAKDIVDYRNKRGPYDSLDELDEVAGIGPATIDKIRDKATH